MRRRREVSDPLSGVDPPPPALATGATDGTGFVMSFMTAPGPTIAAMLRAAMAM